MSLSSVIFCVSSVSVFAFEFHVPRLIKKNYKDDSECIEIHENFLKIFYDNL